MICLVGETSTRKKREETEGPLRFHQTDGLDRHTQSHDAAVWLKNEWEEDNGLRKFSHLKSKIGECR